MYQLQAAYCSNVTIDFELDQICFFSEVAAKNYLNMLKYIYPNSIFDLLQTIRKLVHFTHTLKIRASEANDEESSI